MIRMHKSIIAKALSLLIIGLFVFPQGMLMGQEEFKAQIKKAEAEYRAKRFEAAVIRLERLIAALNEGGGESDQLHKHSFFLLGCCFEDSYQSEKAVIAYEKAIKLGVSAASTYYMGLKLSKLFKEVAARTPVLVTPPPGSEGKTTSEAQRQAQVSPEKKVVKMAEVQPAGVAETPADKATPADQGKKVEKKKKKFPLLIVAGAVALGVILVAVLSMSKEEKKSQDYTLTVQVGNGVFGAPISGSYIYKYGTQVSYTYGFLPGFYLVDVRVNGSASKQSGSFTMTRNTSLSVTASVPIEPQMFIDGAQLLGQINYGGDEDWYWFYVDNTRYVCIETWRPPTGYSALRDSVLYVYGPNSKSTLFASDDDSSSDGTYSKIYSSFEPGTYLIKVTGKNSSYIGFYHIGLFSRNQSPASFLGLMTD